MKKRGVSPVIATVLLIGMVIIIGVIIFLWFRGMTQESITKFGGKNVKLVCKEVNFEASYSDNTLYVSNNGNVPIYSMKASVYTGGNYESRTLDNFPLSGLKQGSAFEDSSLDLTGANKLVLVPVLMGESKKGHKTYMCEENYGVEVSL